MSGKKPQLFYAPGVNHSVSLAPAAAVHKQVSLSQRPVRKQASLSQQPVRKQASLSQRPVRKQASLSQRPVRKQASLSRSVRPTASSAVVASRRMSVPMSEIAVRGIHKHTREIDPDMDVDGDTPHKKSRVEHAVAAVNAQSSSKAKVDAQVDSARDAFSALWTDFGAALESEYDADFRAPPPTAYAESLLRSKPPGERLSWWNGGNYSSHDQVAPDGGKFSYFQDQRATYKRHVPGYTVGKESNSAVWTQFCSKPVTVGSPVNSMAPPSALLSTSESRDQFRAPPSDWPASVPTFHAPPETINFTDEADGSAAVAELTKSDIAAMRTEFENEMSRLGESPSLSVDFHSTYADTFSNPVTRAKLSMPVKRFASGELSESEAAFCNVSPVAVAAVRATPAAGRHLHPEERGPSMLGGEGSDRNRFMTEYEASFVSRDKMERAAMAMAKARAIADARRAKDMAELEKSVKGVSKENKLPPHLAAAKEVHTEYRDRFCHGGDTSFLEDPGCVPDKLPGFIAPKSKVATEYQVAFEHFHPDKSVDFAKSQPPFVLDKKDMAAPYTTEYDGAFCAIDAVTTQKNLVAEMGDIARKTALKPAYALKPDIRGTTVQKSNLFHSEINPGFVARSEAMSAYADPCAKGPMAISAAHMENMRLNDAKLSPEEAMARAEKAVKPKFQKAGFAPALGPFPGFGAPTHSEHRLRSENELTLKWWNNVGAKAWSKSNPITQYPRYAPFSNLLQMPKTEYQQSFVER